MGQFKEKWLRERLESSNDSDHERPIQVQLKDKAVRALTFALTHDTVWVWIHYTPFSITRPLLISLIIPPSSNIQLCHTSLTHRISQLLTVPWSMSEEISTSTNIKYQKVCTIQSTPIEQYWSWSSPIGPDKPSALINWISTIHFHEEHNQALEQRTDGTGTWILQSPEFQQWLAHKFRVLWCPGNREWSSDWYLKARPTHSCHSWCWQDYPCVRINPVSRSWILFILY
jgi:hypothetical protein